MDFPTFLKGIPEIGLSKFMKPAELAISVKFRRSSLGCGGGGPRKPPVAPRQALAVLMQQYFIPLSESIRLDSSNLPKTTELNSSAQQIRLTKLLLQSIYAGLYQVYQAYFPWEVKGTRTHYPTLKSQSQKQVFLFMSDFDICPQLITKALSFQIQQALMERSTSQFGPSSEGKMKNMMGVAFTFNLFIELIVRAAFCAFDQEHASLPEKLYSLLGRMELSKGFSTLESKTDRPHTARMTLLPARTLFQQILSEIMFLKGEQYHSVSQSIEIQGDPRGSAKRNSRSEKGLSPSRQRSIQIQITNREEEEELASNQIFTQNKECIEEVFKSYCAFGEPLNTEYLGSSKFTKLLRDAKILKPIKQKQKNAEQNRFEPFKQERPSPQRASRLQRKDTNDSLLLDLMTPYILRGAEADLLYSRLTGRGMKSRQESPSRETRGRMDFCLFLKAVEEIARRQMIRATVCFREALREVVEQYLQPLYRQISSPRPANSEQTKKSRHFGREQVMQLMKLLQEEGMVELLGLVHRTLFPFFIKYSVNNSALMNFEGFTRFCKDFGIFPDVLPKSRILQFFHTLSQIYSASDGSPAPVNTSLNMSGFSQKREALIDEHLFTESIGLCAMDAPYLPPEQNSLAQPQHLNKYKLVYLLERMSQSSGPEIVLRSYGHTRMTAGSPERSCLTRPSPQPHDLLFIIRKEMPHLFQSTQKNEGKPQFWLDDMCDQ